jgi:hypothetical protein
MFLSSEKSGSWLHNTFKPIKQSKAKSPCGPLQWGEILCVVCCQPNGDIISFFFSREGRSPLGASLMYQVQQMIFPCPLIHSGARQDETQKQCWQQWLQHGLLQWLKQLNEIMSGIYIHIVCHIQVNTTTAYCCHFVFQPEFRFINQPSSSNQRCGTSWVVQLDQASISQTQCISGCLSLCVSDNLKSCNRPVLELEYPYSLFSCRKRSEVCTGQSKLPSGLRGVPNFEPGVKPQGCLIYLRIFS